ncbi:MAG: cell wall hydrolase [Hyphomicrobiales bacterium]
MTGVIILCGVIFLGHYIGQGASARTRIDASWPEVIRQATNLSHKVSLLRPLHRPGLSQAAKSRKGASRPDKEESAKEGKSLAQTAMAEQPAPGEQSEIIRSLIFSPTALKIEQVHKVALQTRNHIASERKKRLSQTQCLAKAIYFEARSESELGQKAIAEVIMNRVGSPDYPNSVCGVVFQNADKHNACQFSFACDGKTDIPTTGKPWEKAMRIAREAINGQIRIARLRNVMNYHADYTSPRWASSMKPVIKIGQHIFYADS